MAAATIGYCENCHVVTKGGYCPVCGGKLREPREDDFCFLSEELSVDGEALAAYLKDRQIDCVIQPIMEAHRSWLALPAEKCRLYVPWRAFDFAREVLREKGDAETERLREQLLQGAEKLNLSARLEKKLRKRGVIPEGTDVKAYCSEKIAAAEYVSDEGRISGCPYRGHYLRCLAGEAVLLVNSVTMEILSVTIRK